MIRRCWYCGTPSKPASRLLREHQTPKARGGTDDPSNIVSACYSCNVTKGCRTVEEFRLLVQAKLKRSVRFYGEGGPRFDLPKAQPGFRTISITSRTWRHLQALRERLELPMTLTTTLEVAIRAAEQAMRGGKR